MFEGGSFGYPATVPELKADSDWVTQTVELKVPAGATRLNIQPAMFRCTGVFEIADLTVTPRLSFRETQAADAVLPKGVVPDWDKARVETVNAKRSHISLNGVWRFVPAAEGGPPKLGWGYIKVPGDWQNHPNKPSAFLAQGGGPQWDLYDGASVTRAGTSGECPSPPNGKAGRSACAWTGCARTRWSKSTANRAEKLSGPGERWTSPQR